MNCGGLLPTTEPLKNAAAAESGMFHESGVVPPRRAPTARGRSHHDDHRATRHIDRRVVWRSPDRQELESDQRILFSGRALSSKYRSALPRGHGMWVA